MMDNIQQAQRIHGIIAYGSLDNEKIHVKQLTLHISRRTFLKL